jgi:3-methyl-2-oxobutanoate hydroxymethyltransferase
MARIMEMAGADILMVGDTGYRYALGGESDIEATVDEMVLLTRSVSRAAKRAPVVGDMPFLSYQVSIELAIANAGRFMKEARADAVKLEGGAEIAPTVRAIVQAGIPVMGHMGLTPQTALAYGGNFNDKSAAIDAERIRNDAFALQEAGVFSIVFTRVPHDLAGQLTRELAVPTLAGGDSGTECDGEVCVVYNMLGLRAEEIERPKSLYGPIALPIYEAARAFCEDVHAGRPLGTSKSVVPA